jgi:hypothetical protein
MILQKRCTTCSELNDADAKVCSNCEGKDLYDTSVIITKIVAFPNGNVAVFDEQNRQIPFIQGMLKTEMIEIEK